MSTEKIKIIYETNKKKKGVDMLTPTLFICLVLSLFGYLYSNIQKRLLNTSWEEKKCSPRYLFFSGFLNPLDKNPYHTTQSNFQSCVAQNIYKDPALSKEIKKNSYYIRKNEGEIKKNLNESKKITQDIKDQSLSILELKYADLNTLGVGITRIFEEQGAAYPAVAKKTSQMAHVLKSIMYYIKNVLIFKASFYKREMSIDDKHKYFMKKYKEIYEKYKEAYEFLDKQKYIKAMNKARDAVDEYNQLSDELDLLIQEKSEMLLPLTETCYQLRYNVKDSACNTLFPHLNEIPIELYPNISAIAK